MSLGRIVLIFMLTITSITFPPLLFLTVPLAIVTFFRMRDRRREDRRVLAVFEDHMAEGERLRVLRSFK